MLVLDQPDKSYMSFKNLSKNFGYLKDLMGSVQGQTLSDCVINEILPIWKNQTIIQAKLQKTNRCASILAQWIGYLVEYSLKKETVYASKRKEPELEKKIKFQKHLISDLNIEIDNLTDKIISAKQVIQCKSEVEEELSEKYDLSPECGKPIGFSMHRGTASGGILISSLNSLRSQTFPNFNDEEIYAELRAKPEEHQISYEGNNEIGCCRMKFFCF